jgi:hypothetical protein
MVLFATPSRDASNRLDQCVTPSRFGGGFNVSVMIRSWSITRGRPGRDSSCNPAKPPRTYRARHDTTVCRDTPDPPRDVGVRHPIGSHHHDPGTLRQTGPDRRGPRPRRQPFTITITKPQSSSGKRRHASFSRTNKRPMINATRH